MIENFELLCSLAVVSGSQNLVRYFPFIPNQFLQRESVRIQLLGEMQHLLQICGIGRTFLGNLPTHALHPGWESNYGFIAFERLIHHSLHNLTADRAFGFNQGAVAVLRNTALEALGRTREGTSFGFHAWLLFVDSAKISDDPGWFHDNGALGNSPTHNLRTLHQNFVKEPKGWVEGENTREKTITAIEGPDPPIEFLASANISPS